MAVGVFDYTLGDSKGFPFDSATPESVPGYSVPMWFLWDWKIM